MLEAPRATFPGAITHVEKVAEVLATMPQLLRSVNLASLQQLQPRFGSRRHPGSVSASAADAGVDTSVSSSAAMRSLPPLGLGNMDGNDSVAVINEGTPDALSAHVLVRAIVRVAIP